MKNNLSEAQMEAVQHVNGPMLVLAGPGSGKTTVITKRVEHLITDCQVNPDHILVITFTKAAAEEMKDRFYKMTEKMFQGVTFGTFHAVFFMMLKVAYHYKAENIIQEEEKRMLLQQMIRQLHLEYEDENELIQNLLSEIGLVKNSQIDLKYYYSVNCAEDIFRKLYRGYEQALRKYRKIDFDDMLVYTYELLRERADILEAWQKKYRYILIDEFQDVNQLQYDIVKLLAGKHENLFLVGDDDQSIYRFRGAKPAIMLNVEKDFPKLKKTLLDKNYRCQKNIVQAAGNLIGYNEERFAKSIEAAKEAGSPVHVQVFESQREQNNFLIHQVQGYRKRGLALSEIAVLFRTNTQMRLLMEQLMEYNLPFSAKDSVPNLYEHWIAKDLYAYIATARGSRSRQDFLKIMNRPKRYLRRESIEEEEIRFDRWKNYYREQPWMKERIEKLETDLKTIARLSPFGAINYIRKAVGYDGFCREYAQYRHMKEEELYDILDELLESAKSYQTYEEWFAHIDAYGRNLKEQQEKQQKKEGIQLATLHSAKGLEFEIVFLVDVNEEIMPYKKAVLYEDIEEERRMFYVGMTRAKEELYLYTTKKVHQREMEASRFIREASIAKTQKPKKLL